MVRMVPNGAKWYENVQNDKNGAMWYQNVRNCKNGARLCEWFETYEMLRMLRNSSIGTKWYENVRNSMETYDIEIIVQSCTKL